MFCLRILTAACLLLTPALPVLAQPAASSLTGRVTTDGSPLRGAIVTLVSPSLLGQRTATSRANGHYFVRAVPPGLYDVYFESEGRQTVIHRVELRLAETSRLDADLALSEDEETVTSTTVMPTLLETPQLSTNIKASTVDRLPIGRSIRERSLLAPGFRVRGQDLSLVDGFVLFETVAEAVEETTFVTGGVPAEYASSTGGLVATITRRGGEETHGALRTTISTGDRTLFEASAGGSLRDELWWFAAGGDGETAVSEDDRRVIAGLTAAIDDQNTAGVSYYDGEARERQWAARYDGVVRSWLTLGALASEEQWALKAHAFFSGVGPGSHSLVAGFEKPAAAYSRALFISDHWRPARKWSFHIGGRHTEGGASAIEPRLGAVYDFREDGEHRISASWARYAPAEGVEATDEATLAYGWRFGVGGYARADYIHRKSSHDVDLVQLHGVYDVFRLFRVGGNYTGRVAGTSDLRHRANLWVWFEPAMGEGTLTLSLLQRQLAGDDDEWFGSTDVGSMYSFPTAGITAFAKLDLVNVFDDSGIDLDPEQLAIRRTWRAAVGLRF